MRRWVYYALALVVLAMGVRALDAQSRVGALPHEARSGAVTYPARLNGVEASTREELEFLAQRLPPGSLARLESASGTRTFPIGREYRFEEILISAICGVLFWGVALFVFADRVRWPEAHLLFYGTLFYGLVIWIGGVYGPDPMARGAWVLPALRAAMLPVLPAVFVCLALVFPRRHPIAKRRPQVLPVVLATGILVGVWHAIAFHALATHPGPERWGAVRLPERLSDLLLIVGDGLGCWLLYRSTKRLDLAREQRQSKWVLWGITIGVTPYAFLHVLPRLLGFEPLIPLWAARLATLTIPTAFAIAVVKYRFLDVDLIIRRSVIYGLLAGAMVGLYLVVGVALGNQIRHAFPRASGIVSALAVAIPVALFVPTRRFIGQWVDRTFFTIQYGYDRALRRLGSAMWRAASARELGQLLESFLDENLAPSSVLVDLAEEAEGRGTRPLAQGISPSLGDTSHLAMPYGQRIVAVPGSTSVPEIERDDVPAALASLGYTLLVHLHAGGRRYGHVLLGPKKSGWRYVEQDLEMLGKLALEAARALERVELLRQMFAEATERKRLDQLERMKSQFLSQVAHDLKTPIASIIGSSQNLLDGVVGPLEPRQREYVEGVGAASRQLVRLVNNLLDVSRLDAGAEQFHLEPVDLASVIREAQQVFGPIVGSRNVRLEERITAGLPRIRADRVKLLRVVTNVLENAVKYSPPATSIEITVDRAGAGLQRMTVRDHGRGFRDEDLARVFDLYHQGKQSLYSSQVGLGIGLFVVRSYIERLDGSVEARNHPEGGAMVSCIFRDWAEVKS